MGQGVLLVGVLGALHFPNWEPRALAQAWPCGAFNTQGLGTHGLEQNNCHSRLVFGMTPSMVCPVCRSLSLLAQSASI